jgi:ATP-dependent Clp protease ATP-binding subunit ClpC
MFERYTEQARRVLFFSRYEASQFGSISIETEHLLLGLIREKRGIAGRILVQSDVTRVSVRKDIDGRTLFHEKVPTNFEIPFSAGNQASPAVRGL